MPFRRPGSNIAQLYRQIRNDEKPWRDDRQRIGFLSSRPRSRRPYRARDRNRTGALRSFRGCTFAFGRTIDGQHSPRVRRSGCGRFGDDRSWPRSTNERRHQRGRETWTRYAAGGHRTDPWPAETGDLLFGGTESGLSRIGQSSGEAVQHSY